MNWISLFQNAWESVVYEKLPKSLIYVNIFGDFEIEERENKLSKFYSLSKMMWSNFTHFHHSLNEKSKSYFHTDKDDVERELTSSPGSQN